MSGDYKITRNSTGKRTAAAATRAADDRRRKNMWFGGLGAAGLAEVVVVVVFSSFSGSAGSSGGGRADGVVDNFSFTLFQGKQKLGAEKLEMVQVLGRTVPPYRAEMPNLQEFYEGSNDEVILLGIDAGQFTGLGSRRDAPNLLKELDITYPAGFTGDGSVVRKYNMVGMPTTVFINPDGTVFETLSGGLNFDILNRLSGAMINETAKEQAPSCEIPAASPETAPKIAGIRADQREPGRV